MSSEYLRDSRFTQGAKRVYVEAKDENGNPMASDVGESKANNSKTRSTHDAVKKALMLSSDHATNPLLSNITENQLSAQQRQSALNGDQYAQYGNSEAMSPQVPQPIQPPVRPQASPRQESTVLFGSVTESPNSRTGPSAHIPAQTPQRGKGNIAPANIGSPKMDHGTVDAGYGVGGAQKLNNQAPAPGPLVSGDKIQSAGRFWIVVDITPQVIIMVSPTGIRHWELKHKFAYKLISRGNRFDNFLL